MLKVDARLQRGKFTLDARMQMGDGIVGIFGRSGSGKTSFLKMLAGLIRPKHGYIELGGRTLDDVGRRRHIKPHQRRVGLVFQDGLLLPHLSVKANLKYGMRHDASGFDDLVELLQLRSLLTRRPVELSGGEQRRVALGRTLLTKPELLLLDEPMTGIDSLMREEIIGYLKEAIALTRTPTLMVSHRLEDLLALTYELLVFEDGRCRSLVVEAGSGGMVSARDLLVPAIDGGE